MTIVIAVIAVLIIVVVPSLIRVRNTIIELGNHCEEAWNGIDLQLTRRHDLVPNLVETVKGYASHEKNPFEEVAVARAKAMKAHGAQQSARSEVAAAMLGVCGDEDENSAGNEADPAFVADTIPITKVP